MDSQGSRLAESLAAFRAFEGFLLGVNIPVIPQVILSPERLAADITGIGPLVRVCPLVDEQIVRLGELSIAKLADELFFRPRCPTRST